MKRLWIGIVVLTVLLAAGIGLSLGMANLHNALAEELSTASQAAVEKDWENAMVLASSARATWEKYRHLAASFTDHEPLEQMDSLFAELKVYEKLKLQADYAAVCTLLSELSKAIAESHTLKWWSFL